MPTRPVLLTVLLATGCAPALRPAYSDFTAAPVADVSRCARGTLTRLGYIIVAADSVTGRLVAERTRADSTGPSRVDVQQVTVVPRQPDPGSWLEVQTRAYSIRDGSAGPVRVDEVATTEGRIDARRVVDECAPMRAVAAPAPSGAP